jgi:endonuclease/exonuclease/phosphatase family metal-dependent hydrolase
MKTCLRLAASYLACITAAHAASGYVKIVNDSSQNFTLTTNQQLAKSIGLPDVLPHNSEQNYFMTLSNSESGNDFVYRNDAGKTFKVHTDSAMTFVDHHTLLQKMPYLTVDWGDFTKDFEINYLLPLTWNDSNSVSKQQVRVDTDDGVIALYKQKPDYVLTVMSYNTDKDGTGGDHDPRHHSTQDIFSLFENRLIPIPDLLMIQEGQYDNIYKYETEFAKFSGGTTWFGFYAPEQGRQDSNMILVNPRYSAGVKTGTFTFKDQSGWGLVGKRNAAYVDISLSNVVAGGSPSDYVRFFDTHLESGRCQVHDCIASSTRKKQFDEIMNYPRDNVSGIVLGGDFNTMPGQDNLTGLTSYKHGDLVYSFDNYMGNSSINWAEPITCTWSTCLLITAGIGQQLDYIYNNPLNLPNYKTHAVYPFVGSKQVDGYSDHLPVWVTLFYEKLPQTCTSVTIENKGWYVLDATPDKVESACYTRASYSLTKGNAVDISVARGTVINLHAVAGKSKQIQIDQPGKVTMSGTTLFPSIEFMPN